jgi:hypothetical protein
MQFGERRMKWFRRKKPDKWSCKWIKPGRWAWWQWQSCMNPGHPYQELKSVEHPDFSCSFEKGCTRFEEGEQGWKIIRDVVVDDE